MWGIEIEIADFSNYLRVLYKFPERRYLPGARVRYCPLGKEKLLLITEMKYFEEVVEVTTMG